MWRRCLGTLPRIATTEGGTLPRIATTEGGTLPRIATEGERRSALGVLLERADPTAGLRASSPSRLAADGKVVEIVAHRACEVAELLESVTNLSLHEAREFVRIGAVRVERRMAQEGERVAPGARVRARRAVRRFSSGALSPVILHEAEDHVVVFKPPGIPLNELYDNRVDSAEYFVSQKLGERHYLQVCHRIDVATRGLAVMGTREGFHSHFGIQMEAGKVHKRYRALVRSRMPNGLLVAWTPRARDQKRLAHCVFAHAPLDETWRECRMTVLGCREVESLGLFELDIELHTGRTHQIRGQLGLLGNPLYNDARYGWVGFDSEDGPEIGGGIGLEAYHVSFRDMRGFQRLYSVGQSPDWVA